MKSLQKEEIKEEFCGPCMMAVPLALGVGGAVKGGSSKGKNKLNNILLIGGIVLSVVSIIIYILWKRRCTECR